MKVDDTKLQQLLEGTQQFVVPLFQRVYSWKKSNWDELWRDLLDIYDPENSREHFMGAIVTMPVEIQPHGINKFLLIDGQQRLTTIFVILACIRDMVDTEDELSSQISELYLINKWGRDSNRHKLLPTKADREAFLAVMDQKQKLDSDILKVYEHFRKLLIGDDNEGNQIDLSKFLDAMINQLVFVSIVLDANDSPYRIFHSLNGTGEPLTQADLVRNHFFMHIPPEDQDVAYSDYWLPMQESFPGNTLRDFMWRFIMKDGTFVRQNGVYDAIRHSTLQKYPREVVDIMMDMNIYAEYYEKMVDPDKESNSNIRDRLLRLNRWEINTAYPFILNLYHRLHTGRVGVYEFCEIMDAIESFVVRRFFCNVPTNALNKYFIQIYRHIQDRPDLVTATHDFFLARNFPNDEQFLAGWKTYPIYSSGKAKSRHILESLESKLRNNNEPIDMSHSAITREHVMPQKLSTEWIGELGDDAISIHAQHLHTIGNLTLTGQNESMGNGPFAEKKMVFENSSFALNTYFCGCTSWGEVEILNRAQSLGEVAVGIWKYPNIKRD